MNRECFLPIPRWLLLSFCAVCMALMFAACSGGGDDDDSDDSSSSSSSSSSSNNTNMNSADDGEEAVLRLEFPKLKGGNSKVIVHRTTGDTQYDSDCVNYAIEWDCDLKSQRWTCYQMHKGYTGNYSRVVSGYLFDPNLDDDEYFDSDLFYGSGYDHGHICPNADRKFSNDANYQTFYLTNMQPQYNKFNGYSGSDEGLWLRIEEQVRDVTPTSSSDTLYVCKGGTIDNEDYIIERIQDQLIVPRYFFTALLMYSSGSYRAIGFWVEQENDYKTSTNINELVVSIDELEELTGIDFFCNLPDDIETKVEKSYNSNAWGLNK